MDEIKKSLLMALWFIFLTFPIMVIRVNPIYNVVEWRWQNMALVGAGAFFLSFLWRYFLEYKNPAPSKPADDAAVSRSGRFSELLRSSGTRRLAIGAAVILALAFPYLFSSYQVNIMTTALIYVVLGLGLNIVVGLAGLLDLGYVAFYAVGAYSYALLNLHFGLSFWICLPIGAALAALFGILLGFPVLRLRGDYLAIVTLGFGEIIRLVLENWNDFSKGPSGIAGIPRPGIPGIEMSLNASSVFLYFLMIALALFTIMVVSRLRNSRIGRAWIALREDEIACQAMGVDKTKTKLTAFALGATWAGMGGVMFAAKTTFINPASFTFLESAIILSIVVLGGMGSIIGVIASAFILILLPEYLRAFSEYRMLIFGAVLVIMMVFRPQGLISNVRQTYRFKGLQENKEGD
ncbi:MAG: high-affinity branched-chain amino acid ABC transporter permease LivM [Desulfuromonadaceae bacterium]|nr:high-affinity branched-chain amino acid ABC transporter permease LivM [Desulfuromonadaceae bacterium]